MTISCVVVVEAGGLKEVQRNVQFTEILPSNNRSDDQSQEYDEHKEVEHGKADDSTLA